VGRERVQPPLVCREDVLHHLELGVDDRWLTVTDGIELSAREHALAVGGDDGVPGPSGGEVEQHNPEAAVRRISGEQLRLARLFGRGKGVADVTGE
jgi:hypothetical protein